MYLPPIREGLLDVRKGVKPEWMDGWCIPWYECGGDTFGEPTWEGGADLEMIFGGGGIIFPGEPIEG